MLLVSYHFPPAETVGARRPAALVVFAIEHGWDVQVLTAAAAASGDASAVIPEDLVVRVAPAPKLPRFNLSPSGIPHSATDRPASRVRLAAVRRAANRRLWRLGMEMLVPDPQLNWIRPATREYLRVRGDWRPDVIVTSGPPFSGFVVAAKLARRLDVPWVADYRDLWSIGNEYWARSRLRLVVDRWIERWVLRSVAACVTVSEPMAETLRATFGCETYAIMNGIDRRPLPPTSAAPAIRAQPAAAGQAVPTLTLAHTGYIYPGKREPGPLLDAIALLGPDAAHIHLVFAGEDNGVVRAGVERAGVQDSVTLLGHVSAEKSWRIQAEADVLVLLMWNDPRDAGTMSGKMFDYLQARRPILLLGYEGGLAAKMVRERRAGVVHNDKHAIAAQLREWLAVKERTGQIPAVPAAALDGLYREDQLIGYIEILRDVALRAATGRGSRTVTSRR
ncbi:glycosyltransferase [Micromonospora sp. U21]|uniref:glycosyltransferase n=1 Tax=Micromonospora sp. U21 TaxID=2824899 RepID=UPI001B35DA2C|nr:glycosyltransferase [Micromonospora sp. U21]MBQ0901395.1 glycosyltransferase [Micromonospora sp. U21]